MENFNLYVALAASVVSMGLVAAGFAAYAYVKRVKRMRALEQASVSLPKKLPGRGVDIPIWSALWGAEGKPITKNEKNPMLVLFNDHLEFQIDQTELRPYTEVEKVDIFGNGHHLKISFKKESILGIYAPNREVVAALLRYFRTKDIRLGKNAQEQLRSEKNS